MCKSGRQRIYQDSPQKLVNKIPFYLYNSHIRDIRRTRYDHDRSLTVLPSSDVVYANLLQRAAVSEPWTSS